MWYGSLVFRHGRSRPFARYHFSRRRRNLWRAAGTGTLNAEPEPFEPFEPREPIIFKS